MRRAVEGVALGTLIAAFFVAPAAQAQDAQSVQHDAGAFDARLARALELFNAGRYDEALTLFDELQLISNDGRDRATLAFNAAVCSFALGDFVSAQRRFEAVARSSPELATASLLHAGLAALRLGDRSAAENFLNQAGTPTPAWDAEVRKRREQLLSELHAADHEARVKELQTRLSAAHDAIEDGQYEQAREQLRQAGSVLDVASATDKADLEYYLGIIDYEQGDQASAQRHFEESLRLRPGDVEAERALFRLYPVSRGVSAFGALSLGYDTNADQAGAGELIATGSSGYIASAYLAAILDAAYAFRTSRSSAVGPYYHGDLLALFNPAVNDLSLQTHEIGASVAWAPDFKTKLELEAGIASVSLGTHPVSQFSWDAGVVGKLTYKTGANSRARFRVGITATNAAHLDYLDGSRWNVSGEEHWQWGAWDFTAQVHGSAVFAGFEYTPTSNLVAACDPSNCNQLYGITYSYWSPGVTAAAGWDATAALHLSLEQRIDYRGYLDASGVGADKATQKFRKDWQFRTRARAEYALDDEDIFELTLEQGLLVSRSNMAQGAGGNSHQFDYADRNFVQSTTELGVEASW